MSTKFKLNMSPAQPPLSCNSKILSTPMSSNPQRNVTEGKSEKRKMLLKFFFFKFYKLQPCEWIATYTGLLQNIGKYWVGHSNIFKNGKKMFCTREGPWGLSFIGFTINLSLRSLLLFIIYLVHSCLFSPNKFQLLGDRKYC